MKVFISWSGETSRDAALILRDWLPCVFNNAKPFVSSEDIRKGNRWLIEISKELSATNFGIICLTTDNLDAPWILFEAGALSKSLKDSNVCTLLLGSLTPSAVKGPIAGFQHTLFRQDDIRKLVLTLNASLEASGLAEKVILKVFDKWWPELESQITEAMRKMPASKSELNERNEIDFLKELLDLTRYIARNTKDSASISKDEMQRMRKLLLFPIEELEFTPKLLAVLHKNKIRNVAALVQLTKKELRAFKLTKSDIKTVQATLTRLHLDLGIWIDERMYMKRITFDEMN